MRCPSPRLRGESKREGIRSSCDVPLPACGERVRVRGFATQRRPRSPRYREFVVHVSSRLRSNAKRLRKRNTLAEQRIWSRLRSRRFGRFKFRRQHPIGRYILDFYCPELKLAIELDGSQHETAWMAEYDGDLVGIGASRDRAVAN